MDKIKIAVLAGGASREREVSLKSAEKIIDVIDKEKYEVFKYDPKDDLMKFFIDASTKKFDIVFPALHGKFGEDGKIQGMLDLINVPYLFSGVLSSAIAMNKNKAKILVKNIGVATAKDVVIHEDDKFDARDIIAALSMPVVIKPIKEGESLPHPVVVKPIEEGSSIGISIVRTVEDMNKAIESAFSHDSYVILEKFIKGREFTVPVIGNRIPETLPVIEVVPKSSDWFDFKAKYEDGGVDMICPANIDSSIDSSIQDAALKIYDELDCKDLARVDFILEADTNILYFLEINTIPGMTETSLTPTSAANAGIPFDKFINQLIEESLKHYKII